MRAVFAAKPYKSAILPLRKIVGHSVAVGGARIAFLIAKASCATPRSIEGPPASPLS